MNILTKFIILTISAKAISQSCHPPFIKRVDDLVFKKIGSHSSGCPKTIEKSYFIPRFFTADWYEALTICKEYGMKLATAENNEQSDALARMLDPHKADASVGFHVGGLTLAIAYPTEFYWLDSGNRIEYDLHWHTNQPDGNTVGTLGRERCLGITKFPFMAYNDINCNSYTKDSFVCEKSI